MENNITIYESIFTKNPHHISVSKALARIKDGKSASIVDQIRATTDKATIDQLKKTLPAVAFAGTFAQRGDKALTTHSGFLVLDFDHLPEVGETAAAMRDFPFTYACWQSPSGHGLKALIRVADGSKHREHFAALRETFPDADPSGANEERLCFESYDPHIYINPNAQVYNAVLTTEQRAERVSATDSDSEVFARLLKWISNKRGAFSTGSRNNFIFALAGACCRYGIESRSAGELISIEFPTAADFTAKEMMSSVRSAYKKNGPAFGTVCFEKDQLVEIKSRNKVNYKDIPEFNEDEPGRDVIYAHEVKSDALKIHSNGYDSISGIDDAFIDKVWKAKRGELSGLTGYGNVGKSALIKWYMLMRCILYGEKFCSFAPEDNPAAEYYHDFVEMLLGADCTPTNPNRPSTEIYDRAYDWIAKHIFYLYPQNDSPTPDYVNERFLEMIVKEKVDGVCIDPFNQMDNDYGARSDKYLEKVLSSFARFAQAHQIMFFILAHPKAPSGKDSTGNYPCPDRYDLADGAMWQNKLDNLLVYHRPFIATNPDDPLCELHSKKIRRQKTVGKPGYVELRYVRATRRFETLHNDPMECALRKRGIDFYQRTPENIAVKSTIHVPIKLPDDFWKD